MDISSRKMFVVLETTNKPELTKHIYELFATQEGEQILYVKKI